MDAQSQFLGDILNHFLTLISSVGEIDESELSSLTNALVDPVVLELIENYVLLLIDLESQLPTRRYFNTLFDDYNVIPICKASAIINRNDW